MSRRHDLQSADGTMLNRTPEGRCLVCSRGAPTASQAGFAPGCIYIDVTNALIYFNSGTAASSTWTLLSAAGIATAVAGVAASYKLARGVGALDGTNPTPITTGLTTVVAATVSLDGTAAPGVGTSVLTVASTNYATGALAVYGWKPTSNADPTLVASTGTDAFEWIAVGT